jgi:hypothetical protein
MADFALNLQTDDEWAGGVRDADPSWNDHRVTLFVNRQGATCGPNPPAPKRLSDHDVR